MANSSHAAGDTDSVIIALKPNVAKGTAVVVKGIAEPVYTSLP